MDSLSPGLDKLERIADPEYMAGLFAYLAEHHPLPASLRQPAPRRRWCRFWRKTR